MKQTKHPLILLAAEKKLKDDLPRSLNLAKVSNAKAENVVKLWDGGGAAPRGR